MYRSYWVFTCTGAELMLFQLRILGYLYLVYLGKGHSVRIGSQRTACRGSPLTRQVPEGELSLSAGQQRPLPTEAFPPLSPEVYVLT